MGLQRSVECLIGSLVSLEDLTSKRQTLTFWAMNWTIHPQLAQVICQALNLRGGMMWDEGLPPGRILVLAETRTVTDNNWPARRFFSQAHPKGADL